MSLDSLRSELNSLNKEKQILETYNSKLKSLASSISGINTLEIAMKIDSYYRTDESNSEVISKVKTSISDIGKSLSSDTRVSTKIELVSNNIDSTKRAIQIEENRIREEEARKAREAEERAKQEEESKKNNSQSSGRNRPIMKE